MIARALELVVTFDFATEGPCPVCHAKNPTWRDNDGHACASCLVRKHAALAPETKAFAFNPPPKAAAS